MELRNGSLVQSLLVRLTHPCRLRSGLRFLPLGIPAGRFCTEPSKKRFLAEQCSSPTQHADARAVACGQDKESPVGQKEERKIFLSCIAVSCSSMSYHWNNFLLLTHSAEVQCACVHGCAATSYLWNYIPLLTPSAAIQCLCSHVCCMLIHFLFQSPLNPECCSLVVGAGVVESMLKYSSCSSFHPRGSRCWRSCAQLLARSS